MAFLLELASALESVNRTNFHKWDFFDFPSYLLFMVSHLIDFLAGTYTSA